MKFKATSSDGNRSLHRRGTRWAGGLAILSALLAIALFSDVLFRNPGLVAADGGLDLTTLFVPTREFGFSQIRQGHFPLWNPHIYCGMPFFGNFQSALLYPPNWLHLLLPMAPAINWGMAFHFFLAAWFTGLWCRWRGVSRVGSILAAVLFACSGAYALRTRAGHLPHLAAGAWAPLLLLCVDRIFAMSCRARRIATVRFTTAGWAMLGGFAVAMQVLSGFPQYVYYTAFAIGIYAGLRLVRSAGRLKVIATLAGMYAIGAALSAVQLLAGMVCASESVRGSGTSIDIAGSYSLPPENLLTLICPGFLGDMASFPYVGRWYLWEASLFIGITGIVLAAHGAIGRNRCRDRFVLTTAVVLLLLALGNYTPLFTVLYNFLPGFSSFRAQARFGFLATLFIALLAGRGYDRLRKNSPAPRWFIGVAALLSIIAVAISALFFRDAPRAAITGRILEMLRSSGQQVGYTAAFSAPGFAGRLATYCGRQWAYAGATLVLVTVLLALARRWPRAAIALAVLGCVEPVVFMWHERASTPPYVTFPAVWRTALDQRPPGSRVINADGNLLPSCMTLGYDDLRGYDVLAPKRYVEFMAMTQNLNPDTVTYDVVLNQYAPVYRLLRCGLVMVNASPTHKPEVAFPVDPMPHLILAGDYRITPTRDDAFAAMRSPFLDLGQTVLLESPPSPAPQSVAKPGTVRIIHETTDAMEIEADLRVPQILLVTDSYSSGWRVRSLQRGGQSTYQVMPADYTLRAIPLAAGKHHFVLEYAPTAYSIGKWISIVAWLIYLAAGGWWLVRRRAGGQ